ncbi:alpha/beta fold hydrolase [Dactylosporangium sp. NPDC050688]|uniref:thioesterase II family protein n=1 Tax=Dactylosporangium sp. NPDC050688 TaxID=3157217 RepID=UPI0034006D1E
MTAFIRPRPLTAPAVRLIGFHHAGGSAAAYFPMSRHLPADWDVALLDLPGRGKRAAEVPLSGMAAVVGRALEDIQPLRDAPVALFGHSMGAIVAWEVARAWTAAGAPPLWMGLSGRLPPGWPNGRRGLHHLGDAALLAALADLGGVPDWLADNPAFRDRFLRLVRADLAAVESYHPTGFQAPLDCPLTVYGGTHDRWAAPAAMAAWSGRTTGPFAHHTFPGGHFYFTGSALPGFVACLTRDVTQIMAMAA